MNDFSSIMEEAGLGMTAFGITGNLWSFASGILAYVFMAIGVYAIAKRRGIKHPWLAWLPFGGTWLLGCISDQYRYVARGQEKSKRKVMLGLEIATFAVGVVAIVLMIIAAGRLISEMFGFSGILPHDSGFNPNADVSDVLPFLFGGSLLCFVMLGLSIALMVINYMALFDLLKSCNPEYATAFLVLSILFGGILQGIFVFAVRKKDLGMPPRQQPMMYTQPVWHPVELPTWQSQQPPVEPWEQNNEKF